MPEMTDERLQGIEQRLAIAKRLKDAESDEPDWYLYDVKPLVVALKVEREKTNRLRSTLSTVATELERLHGKTLEGGMDWIDVSETVALVDAILAETQP